MIAAAYNAYTIVCLFIIHIVLYYLSLSRLVSVLGADVISQCKNDKVKHCILGLHGGQVHVMGETLPALKFLSATPMTNHLLCHLEMDDPYVLWKKALDNGSKVKMELEKQFWGGEYGSLVDPMGCEWSFSKKRAEDSKPPATGIYAYIVSSQCEKHIDWIQRIFEGEVKNLYRHMDTKKVMHCDIAFSGGRMMICDAACGPNEGNCSEPNKDGKGLPPTQPNVMVQVVCKDPDSIWKRAMAEGATVVEELKMQFWGGYFGCLKDPYGVHWGMMKSCECDSTQ